MECWSDTVSRGHRTAAVQTSRRTKQQRNDVSLTLLAAEFLFEMHKSNFFIGIMLCYAAGTVSK